MVVGPIVSVVFPTAPGAVHNMPLVTLRWTNRDEIGAA
jgi:hypothetical protein